MDERRQSAINNREAMNALLLEKDLRRRQAAASAEEAGRLMTEEAEDTINRVPKLEGDTQERTKPPQIQEKTQDTPQDKPQVKPQDKPQVKPPPKPLAKQQIGAESSEEPSEVEDSDERNDALVAEDLEHEHDRLMNTTGVKRMFLTLTYHSHVIVASDSFNYFIIFVIIIAGINVGVQTYSEDPLLDVLDTIILLCFVVEVILKILSEGFKPWRYYTGKDWKWNNFDFTIVFMSLPFWGGLFGSGSLALLRLVRLMRLGKLIKKIPALQMIVQGLTGGLSSIGYILILLFLVYYLFAVVGFYFFGENDPFLFGNIPMAMITLFRCSTLDAWSDIMNMNIYGCSHYSGLYVERDEENPDVPSMLLCEHPHAQLGLAGIYFVVFIVISAMVMLSLFIGTVTMSMNQSMEKLRLLSEKKRKREAYLKNKAIITAQVAEEAMQGGNLRSRSNRPTRSRSRSTKSEPPALDEQGSPFDRPGTILRGFSTGATLFPEQDVLFTKDLSSKDQSSAMSNDSTAYYTDSNLEKKEPIDNFHPPDGPHASIHRAMYVQSVLTNKHKEDPDSRGIGGPFAFVSCFATVGRKIKTMLLADTTAEEAYEIQEKTKRYLLQAMGEDVPDSDSQDIMKNHSAFTIQYLHLCNLCRTIADAERFVNFVTFIIVLAGVVVGFQTDPRALAQPLLSQTLLVLNIVILAVFTLECLLKIVGNGLTPWRYFNDGWNRFDFIIVVGSYVPGAGSLLVILRLLRLLRVLKLLKSLPQLAVILSAMMLGIGSIGYIALILFLVFYVFAILGMILFSRNDPWHFGSLHMSMITLFRVSTLDDWHKVLYINMFGCDKYGLYNAVYESYPEDCKNPEALGFMAVVYFVLFVIVGAQVLLTLFIGVVTTSMDQATETKNALQKLEERIKFVSNRFSLSDIQIENFRKCFELLDLDNGGTIEEEELKIGLKIVNSDMPDAEIRKRMADADPSVDGVDLVGFVIFMSNLPKFKQKRMFLKILRLYRVHRKKKLEAIRKANFYNKMNALVSPRSGSVHPATFAPALAPVALPVDAPEVEKNIPPEPNEQSIQPLSQSDSVPTERFPESIKQTPASAPVSEQIPPVADPGGFELAPIVGYHKVSDINSNTETDLALL